MSSFNEENFKRLIEILQDTDENNLTWEDDAILWANERIQILENYITGLERS